MSAETVVSLLPETLPAGTAMNRTKRGKRKELPEKLTNGWIAWYHPTGQKAVRYFWCEKAGLWKRLVPSQRKAAARLLRQNKEPRDFPPAA